MTSNSASSPAVTFVTFGIHGLRTSRLAADMLASTHLPSPLPDQHQHLHATPIPTRA